LPILAFLTTGIAVAESVQVYQTSSWHENLAIAETSDADQCSLSSSSGKNETASASLDMN
jgi:hypothetical protein